jgi:ABC-type sugar transport system ATPase subunit
LSAENDTQPVLQMEDVTKSFGNVRVLRGVNLTINRGEVHGLLGENGAGKSTLLKILNGIIEKDAGTIVLDGEPVTIDSPHAASALGLSIIHQELSLMPQLSIAENVFLGRLPKHPKRPWAVDWKKCNRDAESAIRRLGLRMDPREIVERLGTAEQQLVEIAKALSMNAKIIAMDEPTASLTEAEIQRLFELMHALKQDGVSIIYVSHRLHEVGEICDRATVLRDGQFISTVDARSTTPHKLATMMVGRELEDVFPKSATSRGQETLRVEHLTTDKLKDVNLTAYSGEILGIAGLVGSGRTEVARAIFGADPIISGDILVRGNPVKIKSPRSAIRLGIGLVPEDRKVQGAVLSMNINHNITLAALGKVTRWGQILLRQERNAASEYMSSMKIVAAGADQETSRLSGGNQQKVVIGKWLFAGSKILIVDEPTRGVDVGARAAIHELLDRLTLEGATVIMVSSDLMEVMAMSDRILVMHEGRISGELNRDEFDEEKIVLYASGLHAMERETQP